MKLFMRIFALILLASTLCFSQAVQPPLNVAGSISAGASTCATTNACVQINLPVGTSSVSVNVTGTFSGTLNFEQSGDFGVTWVSANAIAQPSGSPATSTTTTGLFIASAGGPTAFRVRGSSGWSSGSATVTLTATSGMGPGSQGTTVGIANVAGSTDPCANPSVLKSHVFANITTATTTSLVALSGSTAIYVCGIDVQLDSITTGDTIKFVSGTGSACATPAGCNSGTCTATYSNAASTTVTTSENFKLGFGAGTYLSAGSGNGFCATTTVGTSPTIAVDVTYVQQ